MKRTFSAILLILLFLPAVAAAGGVCPTRANSLEDFRHCMVPLRGTIGTAAVYASGQYDESHRRLLEAMARGGLVRPHVVPASTGYYLPMAAYSPYFRLATQYYYGLGISAIPYHTPHSYGYRR